MVKVVGMEKGYKILGNYIRLVDERNKDLSVTKLLGVSISKKFIPSIANIVGTDLSNYKIVRTGQFAYGPVTSRNGEKISIAYLDEEDCIISSSYTVFEVENKEELDPEYLMLWFSRPEFDRYARYKSHGSVREIFDWNELCMVELPVPDIEKQRKIVKAYKTITDRIALKQKINDNLAAQMRAYFKEYTANNASITGKLKDYSVMQYGYTETATTEPVGPKFLRITDIAQNYIDWNGADYPIKTVVIFENTPDEEKVTVSIERLARQLLDDMGNWSTREAESVDEQIYFYLDEETFNMPDEDIVEYLKKQ